MNEQTAPAFIELVQGKSYTMDVSVSDSDSVAYDLSSGYTAAMVLKERTSDVVLDTLTSAASRINLLDGTADGLNVQLIWTSAQTSAILADSSRFKGVAYLIGDLEIITGGESTFVIRLQFRFRQTT